MSACACVRAYVTPTPTHTHTHAHTHMQVERLEEALLEQQRQATFHTLNLHAAVGGGTPRSGAGGGDGMLARVDSVHSLRSASGAGTLSASWARLNPSGQLQRAFGEGGQSGASSQRSGAGIGGAEEEDDGWLYNRRGESVAMTWDLVGMVLDVAAWGPGRSRRPDDDPAKVIKALKTLIKSWKALWERKTDRKKSKRERERESERERAASIHGGVDRARLHLRESRGHHDDEDALSEYGRAYGKAQNLRGKEDVQDARQDDGFLSSDSDETYVDDHDVHAAAREAGRGHSRPDDAKEGGLTRAGYVQLLTLKGIVPEVASEAEACKAFDELVHYRGPMRAQSGRLDANLAPEITFEEFKHLVRSLLPAGS